MVGEFHVGEVVRIKPNTRYRNLPEGDFVITGIINPDGANFTVAVYLWGGAVSLDHCNMESGRRCPGAYAEWLEHVGGTPW